MVLKDLADHLHKTLVPEDDNIMELFEGEATKGYSKGPRGTRPSAPTGKKTREQSDGSAPVGRSDTMKTREPPNGTAADLDHVASRNISLDNGAGATGAAAESAIKTGESSMDADAANAGETNTDRTIPSSSCPGSAPISPLPGTSRDESRTPPPPPLSPLSSATVATLIGDEREPLGSKSGWTLMPVQGGFPSRTSTGNWHPTSPAETQEKGLRIVSELKV